MCMAFKEVCETQLMHAINNIAKDLDSGKEIDALFLDFIVKHSTKSLTRSCRSIQLLHSDNPVYCLCECIKYI